MSLRTAIDAFCRSCVYDPNEEKTLGDWVQQIERCTASSCPLFAVRPTCSRADLRETKDRARALRQTP
jgi:hypothetical protein